MTSLLLAGWEPAAAQPRTCTLGLVITDRVDLAGLPDHLQAQHPLLVDDLREKMRVSLAQVGRFQILNWDATAKENHYTYYGSGTIDAVVHVILHRANKIFRNQVIYSYGTAPEYKGPQEGGLDYEVVALPAISARLEVRLVNLQKNIVLWSALGDSTAIVPYDGRVFIFNPRKYPGMTHPQLIRDYLADLMRLQQTNRAVDRLLDVADRWFISRPINDLQIAQALLTSLAKSFSGALDLNLPLEGQISALLPAEQGMQLVRLNIGAQHGLVPRLRLEVWRPLPAVQKVGQVEVMQVDSTTAVARLKGLEKQLRKRGEGLHLLDRVISPKRPSPSVQW
ncbi:MAG: hypothetical protein HYW07_01820 [Candidatus Latescibacteria bacterium]|nr:hypothetical protein [Candidatus Latescibacterota bacterium]